MTNLETERQAYELLKELQRIRASMTLVEELIPKTYTLQPEATMKLVDKVRKDASTAMAFSSGLDQLFEQAGIHFKDDETFACMLCVVKKPEYASEVTALAPENAILDPTPEPAQRAPAAVPKMAYEGSAGEDFPFTQLHAKAWRSVRYNVVMEPRIMKKVLKKEEDDRI